MSLSAAPVSTGTAHSLRVGGSIIGYREAGIGEAVVLLHGIGSAARSFEFQFDALSPNHRVIAWDAPGYGQSTCLERDWPEAEDYALALRDFLDGLGIGACHLLGHSLGSIMAARFAAHFPDRIKTLSLCSIAVGHAHLPAAERQRLLDQRLDDVAAGARQMAEKRGPRLLAADARSAMLRRVVEAMSAVRADGYTQAARMLSTADAKADVARLPPDMPVQIVFGDADIVTPPKRNREVAALLPQASVQVIAGAGHLPYLEKPEAFNAVMAAFLAAGRRS